MSHFLEALVQQKCGGFLCICVYFSCKKYVLATKTILAQPKPLGYFSFSKILSGAMMCFFLSAKIYRNRGPQGFPEAELPHAASEDSHISFGSSNIL